MTTRRLSGTAGGLFLGILGLLCLAAGNAAATTHARTHAWSMEHGNLVANWSFENDLAVWGDASSGGMTASARHAPTGFSAKSGRFTGRVAGTTVPSGEILLLRTGLIPVLPGQPYTLSFYVRSSGAVGNGSFPAVRFLTDKVTVSRTQNGTDYSTFSGSSTIGSWTLYTLSFTPDDDEVYAEPVLWRCGSSGVTATLFFDDVVVEEGALDTAAVAARRARHGYSASFSDALGRTHQTHTRLPEDPGTFRVQGTAYDSAGRPLKISLPFLAAASAPGFVEDPFYAAHLYYDGSNPGVPDAEGVAYAEVEYAAEPSSRVTRTGAPGNAWGLHDEHSVHHGFHFTGSLSAPGEIMNPSTDPAERDYLLEWIRDEDGLFALSWINRKGQVVQTARQAGGGAWAYTRMDYDPSGRVRKVRTPLDTSGATFSEVRNYNAQGLLTSTYTRDRGLEKFWYNKRGMLRYSQDDRQRQLTDSLSAFTYYDYDRLGNLVSTGEHRLPFMDQQEFVDGDAFWEEDPRRVESRGWLYGSLEGFGARTGVSLNAIYPAAWSIPPREGALIAAYHRNPASRAPGFTPAQRLVADFYRHDARGRVHRQHKYLGAMAPGERFQTAGYEYDTTGRLTGRMVFKGGDPYEEILRQGYRYDALGRMTLITGSEGDTLAQYTHAGHGPLASVAFGPHEGSFGTVVAYDYHIRGWMREITAYRNGNGFQTYRQLLGYETRALDEEGVPALSQARYGGQITQQLYKFTGDVPNPIRAVNYSYDMLGRMTTADYRHGTGLDGEQYLQLPLSLSDANTLDTRVAYDLNGRILGKRSGGVSSADSTVYGYYDASYRPEWVTGKPSSISTRNASRPGNFQYDAAGRMIGDLSKNLRVSYAHDGMPVEFEARGWPALHGNSEMALHQFYDASGYRVSQVMVPRLASGFPLYWVGNTQEDEDPQMYTAASLDNAVGDAGYRLNYLDYPAPDSVVVYVVLDEGETEIEPEFTELEALYKGDMAVPVVIHGVRKYSAAYDSLMARRTGTKVFAQHSVNMGGLVTGEMRETYGAAGEVTALRSVGSLFGRGTPIGRVVYSDTGEVYQFFIKNHLGSTVRVVNADGSYATTPVFDYQPYGELQAIREDSANPVGPKYTGKRMDTEVNLYYFGARWFDQELGVWISPDPVNDGFNPYGYVSNNPISFHDPYGLWKLGVGIVVGWNRRDGWSVGFGAAADFRDEVGFGGDVSHVWNEDGSQTTTVGAVVPVPVGQVVLYGGGGYSYNTDDGHTASAQAGVTNAERTLGVEIGTSHSWDKSGDYLGGSVYGQAYAGNPQMRVTGGYSRGWGAYQSGPYANARLGAFSWSADRHGARYDGFGTRVATASYDSEKGAGYNHIGKDLLRFLESGPQERGPRPEGKSPTGWFGTNWCGPGGGGSMDGMLNGGCYEHDWKSEDFGAAGMHGALTVHDWGLIAADFQLAGTAFQSVAVDGSAYGHVVGAAYFTLAASKTAARLTADVPY